MCFFSSYNVLTIAYNIYIISYYKNTYESWALCENLQIVGIRKYKLGWLFKISCCKIGIAPWCAASSQDCVEETRVISQSDTTTCVWISY